MDYKLILLRYCSIDFKKDSDNNKVNKARSPPEPTKVGRLRRLATQQTSPTNSNQRTPMLQKTHVLLMKCQISGQRLLANNKGLNGCRHDREYVKLSVN